MVLQHSFLDLHITGDTIVNQSPNHGSFVHRLPSQQPFVQSMVPTSGQQSTTPEVRAGQVRDDILF